jgi:DNA-binding NarL/FixJ family response regulator
VVDVFIVEDDEDFLVLLTRELSKAKKVRIVGSSPTAEKALRELRHVNPDVVLMDIKLPGMNGIECLRRMRRLSPPQLCHVLMLTGREDTNLVFESIKSGASGYLLKDRISVGELSAAIADVAAGGGVMSPSIARKVIQFFQAPATTVSALSQRELEVLADLSDALVCKEIAAKRSISQNTVRKHLTSIYTKLHVHSQAEAVRHYLRRPH